MADGQGFHRKFSSNVKSVIKTDNQLSATRLHHSSKSSPNKKLNYILSKKKDQLQCSQSSKSSSTVVNSINFPLAQPNLTSFLPEFQPEILFLIREHAKTLAALNRISNRLSNLEKKVENIIQKINQIDQNKFKPDKKVEKCENGLNHVLSDDSGGEFSQSTTETDDDELLSLLDQIAKFSVIIKQTQQFPNESSNSREIINLFESGHNKTANKRFPFKSPSSENVQKCLHSTHSMYSHSLSELIFTLNHEQFINNLDIFVDSNQNFSAIKGISQTRSMIPELVSFSRNNQAYKRDNLFHFLTKKYFAESKPADGSALRSSLNKLKLVSKKDPNTLKFFH